MSANRPRVVIADANEEYALRLEGCFLERLRDHVDLEVITDPRYFEDYFSMPVELDVALISEGFMHESLKHQGIGQLFVLTENSEESFASGPFTAIYKYTSLSYVFSKTMERYSALLGSVGATQDPRVILFFSPVGGAGKTTIAAGVASALQEEGNRVLYVDAEYQQELGDLFHSVGLLPNLIAAGLAQAKDPFEAVADHIVHDYVDVVPPFAANLMMLGLDFSLFPQLVDSSVRSGRYDYVVVDTDAAFGPDKIDLIRSADGVVVPVSQGVLARRKALRFLGGLDPASRAKCHLVCGDYTEGLHDAWADAEGASVEARVSRRPDIPRMNAAELGALPDIATIAYLVK